MRGTGLGEDGDSSDGMPGMGQNSSEKACSLFVLMIPEHDASVKSNLKSLMLLIFLQTTREPDFIPATRRLHYPTPSCSA
jgi:hypothetical protein